MKIEELDRLKRTHSTLSGPAWTDFALALEANYPALRSAIMAAKAYLDAFDGDNGPSIVEHEAREALRQRLKEVGL